ncbi:hypothetical protein C8P68_106170 [Mucilaginibacter yixingensis]|uniref:DUF4412 domain-containing protein n=1 Tax=Mucilaginibacter yixingensis TaxID=1295612 RepID=A0A2T5J7A8_9SPHI|nr:hypothetical protein [Mucilaginibacter yixingensis]PTQ94956.1 hypothetical protein C8P68_106170 [Mucilaginibacter yixingensis]
MKNICILIIALLVSATAFAQDKLTFKEGSTLNYDVNYGGQSIVFALTIKSLGDPIKMDWDVQGTGGSYEMTKKGFASGSSFNAQPVQGGIAKLTDDETFCVISQSAFKSLTDTKSFNYGGVTYTVKETGTYKFKDSTADDFYVTSADGKTEMWILNNPTFPVLLKIKGNPNGVDFAVSEVK